MDNPHPRTPLLLPQKLILIREHLNADQIAIQEMLAVSLSGTAAMNIPKATHVTEYENALRRPDLLVALAYSRIGKVRMDSLIDDHVSIDVFQKELGTYDHKTKKTPPAKHIQRKKAHQSKPRK